MDILLVNIACKCAYNRIRPIIYMLSVPVYHVVAMLFSAAFISAAKPGRYYMHTGMHVIKYHTGFIIINV